jgi:hypothetical protein
LYGCGSQDECSGGFYCGIDGFCWPTPLPENTPAASEPETNEDESTADSSP